MRMLRFRLTGPTSAFNAVVAALEGLEQVDRVEEVGDLMGGMRDDSSSSELVDDDLGDVHDIEVHASSDAAWERARELAEACAFDLGVAVEFVDEF